MPCRNSVVALLTLGFLLAACGEADRSDALPREVLEAGDGTGPTYTLRYRPIAGATYAARIEHEVTFQGGDASSADAPTRGGKETWEITQTTADPPTQAKLALVIGGVAKRPITVTYSGRRPTIAPGGGGALGRLCTGPDLGGLAGIETWLPRRAVHVGDVWKTPHLRSPDQVDANPTLRFTSSHTDSISQVRLDAVRADGSWEVRLASWQRLHGPAEDTARGLQATVTIVDRIRGEAVIDPDGQPREFSLQFERVEEVNGQRVRTSKRLIRGRVRRVE